MRKLMMVAAVMAVVGVAMATGLWLKVREPGIRLIIR